MTVTVQLQQTVPHLGQAGQLVQVSQAYARNFLIPKKLAVIATAKVVTAAARTTAQAAANRQRQSDSLAAAITRLADTEIIVTARANASGTLFAALKGPQVITAINQQLAVALPLDTAIDPSVLKTIGTHTLQLKVHHHAATCRLTIRHAVNS